MGRQEGREEHAIFPGPSAVEDVGTVECFSGDSQGKAREVEWARL